MPLVKDLVADFLEHHRQHSKPSTVKIYREGLAWLLRRFGDADWEDEKHHFTRIAIRRALEQSWHYTTGKPMSDSTHARNKKVFQNLQNYIVDLQELSKRKPLTKTDLLRPACTRREELPTDPELDLVIAAASPAYALVLRAFLASAMRPNELCKASVEHIKISEQKALTGETRAVSAIVLDDHKTAAKTKKPRRIVLGSTLAPVVFEAIRFCPDPLSSTLEARTSGPIWLDERGQRWTTRLIRDRWRKIRRQLGLSEKLVPYSLRHQAITKVVKATKSLWHGAQLAGHADTKMTERYAHADDEDLLEAQAALEKAQKRAA